MNISSKIKETPNPNPQQPKPLSPATPKFSKEVCINNEIFTSNYDTFEEAKTIIIDQTCFPKTIGTPQSRRLIPNPKDVNELKQHGKVEILIKNNTKLEDSQNGAIRKVDLNLKDKDGTSTKYSKGLKIYDRYNKISLGPPFGTPRGNKILNQAKLTTSDNVKSHQTTKCITKMPQSCPTTSKSHKTQDVLFARETYDVKFRDIKAHFGGIHFDKITHQNISIDNVEMSTSRPLQLDERHHALEVENSESRDIKSTDNNKKFKDGYLREKSDKNDGSNKIMPPNEHKKEFPVSSRLLWKM